MNKKVINNVATSLVENSNNEKKIEWGEIYYVDFGKNVGSEQNGIRPALVLQNNQGNKFSPTVLVVPITSKNGKSKIPSHVEIEPENSGLEKHSVIMFEQTKVVDKRRILQKAGKIHLTETEIVKKIYKAAMIEFGLDKIFKQESIQV